MTRRFRTAIAATSLLVVGYVVACGSGGEGGSLADLFDASSDAPIADARVGADGSAPTDASTPSDSGDAAGDDDAGFEWATFPTPDAAAFTFDNAFGDGGLTVLNMGAPGLSQLYSVVRQNDGAYVVGGWTSGGGIVMRYSAAGVLDPTFGDKGVVQFPLGGVQRVLLNTDQTIIALGQFSTLDGQSRTYIRRLTTTGALDPTFGSAGTTMLTGQGWAANLQSDGKILAVANQVPNLPGSNGPTIGMVLYRLNVDGSLDPTFGTAGHTFNAAVGNEPAANVITQPDGKIIVGGAVDGVFMARFSSAGAIDSTFGTNGVVHDLGTVGIKLAEGEWLTQDPDGGALYIPGAADGPFGFARFSPTTGDRDSTFGKSSIPGWVIRGTQGLAERVAVQPDGRLVVSGIDDTGEIVARYMGDGGIDSTFGDAGALKTPLQDAPSDMILEPNGAITLAGVPVKPGTSEFWPGRGILARYTATGAPDVGFGTGGSVVNDAIGGTSDEAYGVAVIGGNPVLVGTSAGSGLIARFTGAGALDPSFNSTGTALTQQYFLTTPRVVAAQSSGKLVIGTSSSEGDIQITRLDSAGALDTSFGGGSGFINRPNIGNLQSAYAETFAITPTDALVVAGGVGGDIQVSTGFFIYKTTADGADDKSFNTNAYVATLSAAFGANTSYSGASAIALQADGSIVAAGFADHRLAVVRYGSAGQLDPAFGVGGIAQVDVGAQPYAYGVTVQTDGSIVVLARRHNSDNSSDAIIAKFSGAGVLDKTFGLDGLGGHPLGHIENPVFRPYPLGFAVGTDGKFYVAAPSSADGVKLDGLVLRFDKTGHVDARSVLRLSAGYDSAHGLALKGDGSLFISGGTWTASGGPDAYLLHLMPPP
jgi:uncharacterized delta-60 repeat protein